MKTTTTLHGPLTAKGAKLYRMAGWSTFGICLLHSIYWSFETFKSWQGWLTGKLWDESNVSYEAMEMNLHFWALLGSFMVPLLILSLLIIRAAKCKNKLPGYVGWGLLIWMTICWLIMLPSGFVLGIVPAIFLILANHRNNGGHLSQ